MEDDLQNLLDQLTPEIVTEDKSEQPVIDDRQLVKAEIILSSDKAPDDVKKIDTDQYLKTLDEITQEVLDACRSDRQEAQDIISMFRSEINNATTTNRQPSRMYIDGLVKALEVKTNINSTAVKMIETNAKMLAAMKVSAGPNVQINNANVAAGVTDTDASLERILSEPLSQDDEY